MYDNKRSKHITWIIPLLMITEIPWETLADKLTIPRINITADGYVCNE